MSSVDYYNLNIGIVKYWCQYVQEQCIIKDNLLGHIIIKYLYFTKII